MYPSEVSMDALDTIHAHDEPELERTESPSKGHTPVLVIKHGPYILTLI